MIMNALKAEFTAVSDEPPDVTIDTLLRVAAPVKSQRVLGVDAADTKSRDPRDMLKIVSEKDAVTRKIDTGVGDRVELVTVMLLASISNADPKRLVSMCANEVYDATEAPRFESVNEERSSRMYDDVMKLARKKAVSCVSKVPVIATVEPRKPNRHLMHCEDRNASS